MSDIKNVAYTPNEIGNIKFRIPLYQRPYAWESKQVKQLLDDLFKASEKNENYYIGILSIGKTETDENLFDLIDGQQRITTLALIGRVLQDKYKEWAKFLDNRLDLYGRKEDKEFLVKLVEKLKTNPKMIDAVKTVNYFLKDKFSIDNENQNFELDSLKVSHFSKYVYEHAAFFLSEVPKDYTVIEKNLQFVRMNNRGKQLELHDILKMKLANKIDESKKYEFFNTWTTISQMGCIDKENSFIEEKDLKPFTLREIMNKAENNKEEPKEVEIFYQSIVSFPEFLLIGLKRFNFGDEQSPKYLEVSHKKDNLLQEFGFGEKIIGFEWNNSLVNKFIELLSNQYNTFIKFFIKRDKEEKYKLPLKNVEQFVSKNLSLQHSIDDLKMFQSYLYVSTEPHKWLIDAFNFLKCNTDEPIDAGEFLNELKKIDNKSHKNISDLNYRSIDRYWFWRLDFYLWENRNQIFKDKALNVSNNYVFRENRSIEHIAPQTPEENISVKLEPKLLHCFGNLAMISSSQNSSLKNSSFEVKRAHVDSFINGSKNGTIESLKLLQIFSYDVWVDNVSVHGNEMIDVLIDSFPVMDEFSDIRRKLAEQRIF